MDKIVHDIPMDSCDCSWKIMSMDIIALKILLEIAVIASKTLVDGYDCTQKNPAPILLSNSFASHDMNICVYMEFWQVDVEV